jgi:3-oxoacyl-[acyl-carrier protein] reductase
MLLKDKVAFITGAAQGIGQAIAAEFSKEGALVVLTDIQGKKLAGAARVIRKSTGRPAAWHTLDVGNGKNIRVVVAKVKKDYGRIDILVNNAGIQEWVPFLKTTEKLWDRHFAVNVKGPFILSQAVAPIMIKQGCGKIINMSSDSGVAPVPEGAAAYCSSKSAVIGLTRSLARELGRYGVYCNAICPGAVSTPMTDRLLAGRGAKKNSLKQLAEMTALKKIAEPADIARVAVFLASRLSDHITGERILVTGGDIMTQ